MSKHFKDSHHMPLIVLAAQQLKGEDIFDGAAGQVITSDVLNMSNWGDCFFIVKKLAGGTGTATVTAESCDNTTPTTNTAIAFEYRAQTTTDTFGAWTAATTSGVAITAGADELWEFHVADGDLVEGHSYLRFVVTETESTAVDGATFCLLTNPRYAKTIPDTVLT